MSIIEELKKIGENYEKVMEAAKVAGDLAQHWQHEAEYWRTMALALAYGDATDEQIQELRRQNPPETRIPNNQQELQSQAKREIVQRNRDMMEAKRLRDIAQKAKVCVEEPEQRDQYPPQIDNTQYLPQMVEDLREASVLVADTCNLIDDDSLDSDVKRALRETLNTLREGSDFFQSRIEQLEKKDGQQQDGWYSSGMAYHFGTNFWATAGGEEVEATSVGVAPTRWRDNRGVVPWDDAKSIGPVTRWLRKGRPSTCNCGRKHDCRSAAEIVIRRDG